ncbi:hypothetical protein CYMTET_3846 [Cymbomonas tetramitiformis]|uniref:Uncharacterized protein n=1 Tax=Cymbomonas tetramitiformis TaxID=36881 RepID=A0AAE0H2F0_9CHLO|nr:hypothetical protein CYMTET_3846 [Cymbomonas tetramitiformis]
MATAAPGAYVGTGGDVGTARPHGVDSRQMTSGSGLGTASFEPYFGENPKPYMLSPYDSFGRENFALPEAYLGYSPYMTNVMINLIKTEDMWPTAVLPYRETKDTSTIRWDEIHFNRHFLGPVPEEGVSRLVSQEMNERRDHYTRYGLAMILEHGFMNTDKGRMCYVNNLQQIRNAVLETVYLGVLEAFLRCKNYDEVWNERFGGVRSASAARKAMMMEVEDWATIQKTEHGWDLLDSRCKRFLRSKNVTPDTWIIPEGLKPYISQVRRENYTYMLAGPEGPQNFKSGLNGQSANVVDARNDCKIYESKSFELPDMNEPVDVMRRNRAIGEFYLMCEDIEALSHSSRNYTSSQRNIVIYDEDVDNFTEIRLLDAFMNDAIFGQDSEATLRDAFKEIEFFSVTKESQRRNMHHSMCDPTFGDIPEDCSGGPPLSDTTIDMFANTFFNPEEKQGFVEDFCRNMPMCLRDLTADEYEVCTPNFNKNLKELLESVRTVQDVCALEHTFISRDCLCKCVRTLFAKSKDTYAFWMFCHSVAASKIIEEDPSIDDLLKIDGEYRSMYVRLVSSRSHDDDLSYPQPPEMTVQCFQQTVCAVFVTIMRLTCRTKQFLKLFEELHDSLERVSGELCGLWFDGCDSTSAKSGYNAPSVDLFNDITKSRMLVRGESEACYASRENLPNRTFRIAMFITRAMFQYMSVNQTIRRGDPCDCVPIGYNTHRGVKLLAATTNERFYEQESCSKMLQSYEHLRERIGPIFDTKGLHTEPEDLFNLGIMHHRRPGNILINMPSDLLPSGELKTTYVEYARLSEHFKLTADSKLGIQVWMDICVERSLAGTGRIQTCSLQRCITELKEKAFLGPGTAENQLEEFLTSMNTDINNCREVLYIDSTVATAYECLKTVVEKAITMGDGKFTTWASENSWEAIAIQVMLAASFAYLVAIGNECDNAHCLRAALDRLLEAFRGAITNEQVNAAITAQHEDRIVKVVFEDDTKACVELFDGLVAIEYFIREGKPMNAAKEALTDEYLLCDGAKIRTVFKAPTGIKASTDAIFTQHERRWEMHEFVQHLHARRFDHADKTQCDRLYDDLSMPAAGPHDPSVRDCVSLGSSSSRPSRTIDDSPWFISTDCKTRRIREALRTSRAHELIVHLLFCQTKVTHEFLKRLILNDVMFPFGYLLLRPHQTYEMCTAVLTKSGTETGETLIGHYDFQLSDNVVQKMHYGNFTIYEKSIIYRPMNVHLAEDIFCANYLGGAGSAFHNAGNKSEGDPFYDKIDSLYACAIGFDEIVKDNPISVNGRFEDHTGLTSMKEPHFSTCQAYKRFYGFHEQTPPSGDMPYFDTASRGNTVCFQGHQASYNHTSGYLDRVTLNTGHWGERVYPGCGKVRRGLSKYLEPVNYHTMRRGGGGAISSGFGVLS